MYTGCSYKRPVFLPMTGCSQEEIFGGIGTTSRNNRSDNVYRLFRLVVTILPLRTTSVSSGNKSVPTFVFRSFLILWGFRLWGARIRWNYQVLTSGGTSTGRQRGKNVKKFRSVLCKQNPTNGLFFV